MTVEAPEKQDRDIRAELDAMLEITAPRDPLADVGLPAVLGDYRAVEGHPGWYMRRMKLRQEQQAIRILNAIEDRGIEGRMEDSVTLATLLLWRLTATRETARDVLQAWSRGEASPWRPATADEVLDTFDMVSLNDAVLAPMGFGTEAGEEDGASQGNAAG